MERERGDGRNVPQGSVSTAISQTSSVVAQIVNETGPVGVMATYIDDGAFVGLPEAAPEIPVQLEDEMDRHTSEEDGVSRGPMVTDPVATATSPEVRASVGETSHQDRPPIFPCIYPGWRLWTPPQELWPPLPDWGGLRPSGIKLFREGWQRISVTGAWIVMSSFDFTLRPGGGCTSLRRLLFPPA